MNSRLMVVLCLLFVVVASGVSTFANGNDVWQPVTSESVRSRTRLQIAGDKFLVYRFNDAAAKSILRNAPMEFSADAQSRTFTFQLPMPDGKFEWFRVVESPVMAPELQAQFPDWRTYQAYGIDDPTATARFGITLNGFHASVFSTKGTFVIDPITIGDTDNYIVYSKDDLTNRRNFHCKFDETISGRTDTKYSFFGAPEFSHGAQIRTYRLAIAASGEYTAVFGGTAANGLAAVTTTANRMNGIYRKDFAVGLQLVANNLSLIYTNAATDPYTNTMTSAQLTANQNNTDSVIGSANYDVGHLFVTADSGLAGLGVICVAGNKARGGSGQPNPQGDGFDVDYVAHEIGHQIGGNHTFNSDANCGSGSAVARKEPGSGVTIMSYAGICGSIANLQGNAIDNFLGHSQQEAITFLGGSGGGCGTLSGSNAIPVVTSPGASFSIPFNTPFALTASATDANGDALTYSWEHDSVSGSQSSYPGTTDDDDTNLSIGRILNRPYRPSASPTRNFPSLTYILNNANEAPLTYTGTSATGTNCFSECITGEDLPSVARTISYRVTVRDNQGGVADAFTSVTTVNTATPFAVTSQNTAVNYNGNSSQTVTWNVSGTTAAPISAANVRITLSTDGGNTFPNVLAASTANDGSETVTIPNIASTTARIKVEAVGNIFFDINSANFTITAVPVAGRRAPFDYDGDDRTDLSIFRSAPGEWWYSRSSTGVVVAGVFGTSTDVIVPGDYTGDQKSDIAFFRPSTGQWFILRSEDNSFLAFPFGTNGDIPVPGDYDNDGKFDSAVFRPSSNTWFINKSGGGIDIFAFGSTGDKPVPADYDGDNKTDVAIYRPSNGQWWVRRSSDAGLSVTTFGVSTDRPVQGYFTADNKADVAFWRPSTGEWFILRSEDNSFFAVPFGTSSDIPVPGDYDGDDRTDVAVFRPTGSNWFLQRSTAGLLIQTFGISTDKPTPSAYIP